MTNKDSANKKRPRLPPGQHIVTRFPVLQKGNKPHIDRDNYILTIEGEVQNPTKFSLQELMNLQDSEIVVDIHCVTSWSKYDTKWGGITFHKLFEIIKPKSTGKYVEFLCADENFTTTIPIERLTENNTILALTYEGEPINDDHGGPVRPIIPNLYFYKSAKWVQKIFFLKEDKLGYWERAGYSNKADPWREERYSYHD